MIQDFFDKVYVINLETSTDRLELITEKAQRAGVEFERWEAVPGSSDRVSFNEEDKTEGWNENAYGLTLTTIDILEDAKQKGYNNVFILEDDANFTTNLNNVLSKIMRKIPEDWDFIHLNANHQKRPDHIAPVTTKITRAICCQAYGISSNMYDIYLDRLKTFSKPIDEHTADLHEERGNSYAPSANIVYHVSNLESTIREEIVNY